MEQWQLPEGWEWRTLGRDTGLATINPRRPSLVRDDETFTSFLPMQGVDEVEGIIAQLEARPYREVRTGYTYFEENDVLFAKITPSMQNGKSAIARGLIDGLGFGSTEFHVLRPKPGVLPQWLHLFVRQGSFREEAMNHFRGAVGQQRVPQEFLESHSVPFPFPNDPARSLETQRRIVARIEALFAELRAARELHETIVEDTDRLMDALISESFDPSNPKWKETRLSEIAHIQTGTAKGRRFSGRMTVDVPYLRVANVQAGYLDLHEIKNITIPVDEIDRYRLQIGDLLLTEGGDSDKLGRGAVWKGEIDLCIHQNHIFAVRFDQSVILPEFMEYEMQSRYAKTYFLGVAKKTTNLATINKTQLGAFPVRYPVRENQEQIITYLDAAKGEVSGMVKMHEEDSKLLEQVEQGILAQAFRGEL